jgi:hypothetical protein
MFVDPISGKPTTEESSKKRLMYFIKGTEPEVTDPVFDEMLTSD